MLVPAHRAHSHPLLLRTTVANLNPKKGIKKDSRYVNDERYLSGGRDTFHLVLVGIGVASINTTCSGTKFGVASVGVVPLGHLSKSVGCSFAN